MTQRSTTMDPSAAVLLEQLGDIATVRWTPALREVATTAPNVVVELEQRGRVRARLLRERTHSVRLEPGTGAHAVHQYVLVLLAIEGETEPRWVAAERVVLSPVAEV